MRWPIAAASRSRLRRGPRSRAGRGCPRPEDWSPEHGGRSRACGGALGSTGPSPTRAAVIAPPARARSVKRRVWCARSCVNGSREQANSFARRRPSAGSTSTLHRVAFGWVCDATVRAIRGLARRFGHRLLRVVLRGFWSGDGHTCPRASVCLVSLPTRQRIADVTSAGRARWLSAGCRAGAGAPGSASRQGGSTGEGGSAGMGWGGREIAWGRGWRGVPMTVRELRRRPGELHSAAFGFHRLLHLAPPPWSS